MRPHTLSRLARRLILGPAAIAALILLLAWPGGADTQAGSDQRGPCSRSPSQDLAQNRLYSGLLIGDHPERLDRDLDGLACERLPCPCARNGAGVRLRVRPKVGRRRSQIIVSLRSSRRVPTNAARWYSAEVLVYPCQYDLGAYRERHRAKRDQTVVLRLTGTHPWCLGRHWISVEMCTYAEAGECYESKLIGLLSFLIVRRPPS